MSRVLILYNQPVLPAGHSDAESEREVLDTVAVVGRCLREAGYAIGELGLGRDPAELLEGLRRHQPEVVFNLFEGHGDQGDTEVHVAGLLEWLGMPFTGCPSQSLCLARNKPLTKTLLQGAGLPTPAFFSVDSLPGPECSLVYPVIVKPAEQDASIGLDQGSVVTDQGRLNQRIAHLLEHYGPPVLVEEYIHGREFNVGLIDAPELRVLPISEIVFTEQEPGYWPIVTYDAKWKPGSRDYEATPPHYPADISPQLAGPLAALGCQAFRLLGCRDYARVDFRARSDGEPFILEVNPNPDLNPSAGLAGALASAGISHAQCVVDFVRAALGRGEKRGRPISSP